MAGKQQGANMKNNDLEALAKLDEAIQSLKEAGYEFISHTIVDTEKAGQTSERSSNSSVSKRWIEMKCYKYFPIPNNEKGTGVRQLASFSGDPNP